MAKYNAEFTPPSATMLTELYYAETDTVAPTPVFGVQGIPEVDTPPDDITYRTLESDVEYGVPGVKPFSAIEVEILYYKEQYTALKALEGKNLFWYVKLPDNTAGSTPAAKSLVKKWKGDFRITLAALELDDMVKCTLKIYKATAPEDLTTGLPTGDGG